MIQSGEEFLLRFGDVIDDRVAAAVEEMLSERAGARRAARLRPLLAAVTLSFAVAASVMLRHNIPAACTIWPSAAIIYLAAIRFAEASRT